MQKSYWGNVVVMNLERSTLARLRQKIEDEGNRTAGQSKSTADCPVAAHFSCRGRNDRVSH
jgi:hypothetical protein